MGVIECAPQLLEQLDRFAQGHGVADPVGQRAALDQLQDEVGELVVVAEIEDFQDVGVPEASHRARLLLEALAISRVVGKEVGQDFDRDVAVQTGMVGAVHARHPAAADVLDHSVSTEGHAFADLHATSPSKTRAATAGGESISPAGTTRSPRVRACRRARRSSDAARTDRPPTASAM